MTLNIAKKRLFYRIKSVWSVLTTFFIYGLLTACSTVGVILQTASKTPTAKTAQPSLSTLTSLTEWKNQKADIRATLQDEIYGPYPATLGLQTLSVTQKGGLHFGNRAIIEHHRMAISAPTVQSAQLGQSNPFDLIVIKPPSSRQVQAPNPIPIIVMQSFCPVNDVIPEAGLPAPEGITFSCKNRGILRGLVSLFFGRYIRTPPIEDILDAGYGLAILYPPEFMPDSRKNGLAALAQFFAETDNPSSYRAISTWAKQFSLIANYLKSQSDFSHSILYGHSRYGKTALLALAFDENIDGAIAHQSGTGGASLSRDKPGETVEAITRQFPHWFSAKYSEDNITYDQHYLIALAAPRPILLGNARRDVWSDPNGAYNAALAATPIYQLHSKNGLTQNNLGDFQPMADIAFWMRPGTHGVVKEDWPAFMEFLNAHFK